MSPSASGLEFDRCVPVLEPQGIEAGYKAGSADHGSEDRDEDHEMEESLKSDDKSVRERYAIDDSKEQDPAHSGNLLRVDPRRSVKDLVHRIESRIIRIRPEPLIFRRDVKTMHIDEEEYYNLPHYSRPESAPAPVIGR
jgi:hypothetical protein